MKRKKMLVLFVLLSVVVFLCPSLAMATNGMRLIAVGPIQKSMGGTNIGLPLDSAVAMNNPAGISQLEKRIDFGFSLFLPKVSYSAVNSFGQITAPNRVIDSDSTSFVVPAFGLVVPWTDKVTLGLGAYGVTGMGVDYVKNLYNNVTFTEYAVMKFNPTIAYKLTDDLAFGIAPSIGWASFEYEAGTTAQSPHKGGDAFGIGACLGLYYTLDEKTSLGVYYETPQWFQDFKYNAANGVDKMQMNQPQSAGVGFGYRASENLRLGLDIVWIDWSNQIGENKPGYTQNNNNSSAFNMNWDDQLIFRLGGEYDLNKKTKLRAGYNFGENPLNSNQPFEVIAFPAIAEHHFTAGVGYAIKENLDVNLGVVYSPESSMDVGNAAQFITSAETKMSQFTVDFGFSFKFD